MASLDASMDGQLKGRLGNLGNVPDQACFRLCQKNKKERNVILRTFKKLLTVKQNDKAKKRLSVFIPWMKASFTLEASIVLCLLLLALYGIWYLFFILHVQVVLQTAAEQTAQQAAVYAYAQRENLLGNEGDIGDETESQWGGGAMAGFLKTGIQSEMLRQGVLSSASREALDNSCIQGGSGGITFTESSVLGEEGVIDIVLRYQVHVPIGLPGLQKLSFIQRSRRHAWIGDGGAGSHGSGNGSEEEKLYITENGTVYHLYEDCSHIKLSIKTVPAEALSGLRNENGGKYYPCERCNREGHYKGTVYITEDGNRYHVSLSCSGLKRQVRTVLAESVPESQICSRCRKRREEEKK